MNKPNPITSSPTEQDVHKPKEIRLVENRLTGFCFIIPVWGKQYLETFVDLCIPSLLARGNIPDLSNRDRSKVLIYTDLNGYGKITNSKSFLELTKHISVQVLIQVEDEVETNKQHQVMTKCYREGMKIANREKLIIGLITPDMIFSTGSFVNSEKILTTGKKVIFIPAVRLVLESVREKLITKEDLKVLQVTPQEMTDLTLEMMHPICKESIVASHLGPVDDKFILPSHFFWVTEKGILARCFHLHPLFVLPAKNTNQFYGTVDADFIEAAVPNTEDHYIVTDSNEVCAVELSTKRRLAFKNLSRTKKAIIGWIYETTNKNHLNNVLVEIYIHNQEVLNKNEWRDTQLQSNGFVTELVRSINWRKFYIKKYLLTFESILKKLLLKLRLNRVYSILKRVKTRYKYIRR